MGFTQDNKPYYMYVEKGDDGHQMEFFKLIGKHKTIGSMIEVTKTESGIAGPYVLKGIDNNNPKLSDWRTKHWANEELAKAVKAAEWCKKGFEEEVQALRMKYKKLPANQRSLFIAALVYDITK